MPLNQVDKFVTHDVHRGNSPLASTPPFYWLQFYSWILILYGLKNRDHTNLEIETDSFILCLASNLCIYQGEYVLRITDNWKVIDIVLDRFWREKKREKNLFRTIFIFFW